MDIALKAKAFDLLAAWLAAQAVVINMQVMQSDIKYPVHMDAVIGVVIHRQIAHINVDHVRSTNAVSTGAGIITAAVFSALDQPNISYAPKVDIMKIVLFGVAVVMQLQVCRRYTTDAFQVDPVAAVLHLNILQGDITATGFFTGRRIPTTVKEESYLMVSPILTVRPLVNGADQLDIFYRDVDGGSGIEQRGINGAADRRTPGDNGTRPPAFKRHIAAQ